ncbi:cyclin-like protein [Obba rivulosa]|uniref:Cyclin-like protein n=1 Tax=Obba rivulosa TaxID=1052685 RepID=A0A8E2DTH7_9APHY|nr:cyclin-like protein [Obba rivulosa]
MGATYASSSSAQWLFPISALQYTPSRTKSSISQDKELYDRARGIEFLFRLGVSLQLPSSAMYTAATWFHRFYMRYSMEDYHRQDVAASCIFLATKTEECGRKLRDVAKVVRSKISRVDVNDIPDDSKELEECQTAILLTEEALLEALCFDFVVDSPHAELVDLFDSRQEEPYVEDCAWTIANDSYRTPLCILHPPRIIAAACFVLAQHLAEGPNSPPLDVRIASPAPSASLPTPPSHKAPSPRDSRFAIEHFGFNEMELAAVADVLRIILEFYAAQDTQHAAEHLASVAVVPPPKGMVSRDRLYQVLSHNVSTSQSTNNTNATPGRFDQAVPESTNGDTPGNASSHVWKPIAESK